MLGAGGGWAQSILFHEATRGEFAEFFARRDTFTLGVCNGCQMLALLRELIPGAQAWPRFLRNRSEQFEARLSLVEILESPSVLFGGMQGSVLPIAVSHGEGRAAFATDADQRALRRERARRLPLQRRPRQRRAPIPRQSERHAAAASPRSRPRTAARRS